MQTIQHKSDTHKRYWISEYAKREIYIPNLVEQKAIVDKLDDSFAKIENAITNLINAKENLKLYKQSVLKSAFNGDLLPNTSPTQRKKVKFEDVLKYEQPTKYIVKSTKYNNDFKTPVLTAGKGFILGYTNETEGIFTNTPVIIFDDFTTSSQYVNFHFKVKSSAMKILRPADNVNLKFLFYKMQTIQHKSDTHKRYWISEYAKLEIPLPPLSEQNLIVAEIDRRFAIVDKTLNLIDKSIQNAKNLKQSILKKAFSGELRSEI
ncbi:restriction endonuclease subunit S, partial [Campylobacter sp.]|uniref:restriction endonuclease subunit S n=1 Tax=Campylobacter sp. TaxID=205 RepID=UPI0025C4593E